MNTTTDTTNVQDIAIAYMTVWALEAGAKGVDHISYIQDRCDEIEDTEIDVCIFISKVVLRYISQH